MSATLVGDQANDVLLAASAAVRGLSPNARRNLAAGAGFVRLNAYDARRLIAAVEALEGAIDEEDE